MKSPGVQSADTCEAMQPCDLVEEESQFQNAIMEELRVLCTPGNTSYSREIVNFKRV